MEAESTSPACSLPRKESQSNGAEADSCKRTSADSAGSGTPCFWNILDPRKDAHHFFNLCLVIFSLSWDHVEKVPNKFH